MAVTADFNSASYTGNGSTVEFDLANKVFSTDEVTVFIKTISTGAVVTLVEDTDYTIAAISGDLDNGVTVTTIGANSPRTSDEQITLDREIEETQELELETGGDMPAEELEDALDRGIMVSQQISAALERSISFPVTDAGDVTYDVETDIKRAGKALGFTANGSVTSLDLADSGTIAVDVDAGLSLANNIISGKVDDSSLEFDGFGNFAIKDGGVTLAKMDDVTAETVLGNTTGSSAPVEVPILGATGLLLDEDLMGTDSALKGATQQSIKAYADGVLTATTTGSTALANGLIIQWGETATFSGTDTEKVITFTPNFTTPFQIIATIEHGAFVSGANAVYLKTGTLATTGATFMCDGVFTTAKIRWVAIGF